MTKKIEEKEEERDRGRRGQKRLRKKTKKIEEEEDERDRGRRRRGLIELHRATEMEL